MNGNEAGTTQAGGGSENQGITPAVVTNPQTPTSPAPRPLDAAELAKVRQALVAANPQAVPELIAGDTVDALLASVETAKQTWERVAAAVQGEGGAGASAHASTSGATTTEATAATAPVVPAGGGAGAPADVEKLSPATKIMLGLDQRAKGSAA